MLQEFHNPSQTDKWYETNEFDLFSVFRKEKKYISIGYKGALKFFKMIEQMRYFYVAIF